MINKSVGGFDKAKQRRCPWVWDCGRGKSGGLLLSVIVIITHKNPCVRHTPGITLVNNKLITIIIKGLM